MSATTHTPVEELETDDEHETPWWADRAVLIPIASGVAFVAGLACEWSGAQSAALVLFWVGLLLGASTFVPGALRKLATGKLEIGRASRRERVILTLSINRSNNKNNQ